MRALPIARTGAALAALSLLAACASGTDESPPTWRPAPSFQGENVVPGNPLPSAPGGQSPNAPNPDPSTSSPANVADPNVVATKLRDPIGVTILPDNTALVGERTTGRIVRVQPRAGQPVKTVRTIPGLSTAGGGGLLDLALSPNYSQDNLIFAYITTPTDNRVITFTLTGPITTVLTGIPRGTKDNIGRLAFSSDGSLLVGTGDAGHPALAANPSSLAGKVLRVTDIGTAAKGNPTKGSRVYTTGHRAVDGLCVDASSGLTYETETGTVDDPINLLTPGANYGWPSPASGYMNPIKHLPATGRSPGGCAVLDRQLYVTTRDGKALLAAPITSATTLGMFTRSLTKYGRLRTVVAAADGALWLTTSNRDGSGTPVTADDRVLRIVPSGDDAGKNA